MSISKKSFWKEIERPIKVLAPMAGYTDSAFRLVCRSFGADVVMTELISADAIYYLTIKNQLSKIKDNVSLREYLKANHNSTLELLSFHDEERPIVIQLFGKYPEKFAVAAKWVTENLKPDGIDINMGCPARKVVGSDHGAALMKNPELASEIVKAVKENTNLPVSVKTRLGWDSDDQILEFGPKMVLAGAEALIVHGRTYKDAFSGAARWENIYRLKELLGDRAVVIGNGDIKKISNIKYQISKLSNGSMVELDGIAIGRAAFGKPWIFSQNTPACRQGRDDRIHLLAGKAGITALKDTILKHAKFSYEDKGAKGIIEFRKHLLSYLKGFANSKTLRTRAVKIESLSDIEQILDNI